MSPLDPQNLTPANSLNRVQVIDLPGVTIDSEVKGKTGYELVSVELMIRNTETQNKFLCVPVLLYWISIP